MMTFAVLGDAGDPNRFQQLLKNPSKSNGIKMLLSYINAKMSNNVLTKEFLKENDLNEETIDKYLWKELDEYSIL